MTANALSNSSHCSAAASPAQAGEDATRFGMLMEAAHLQQQLAESSLARLEAHTKGLDAVVREQIRQSFITECSVLEDEMQKAVSALRDMQRVAERRAASWTVAILATLAGAAIVVMEYAIPSPRDIGRLRSERDALALQIKQLKDAGAGVDLRRCGARARLCVRVDRSAPSYGDAADYLIVRGH